MERTRDDKAIEDFDQFPTTPGPTVTTTTTPVVNRGTMVFSMTSTTGRTYDDGKYTTQAPIDNRTSGKYSTARRLETSRTTPFYTPTIPTIATRFEGATVTTASPRPSTGVTQPPTESTVTVPTSSTTPLSLEKNPINVSEHAMEMMKTLQELEMTNFSSTSATPDDSDLGTRLGLNIPPSSGPDALHSLAVYFANAMDNATKTAAANNSNTDALVEVETSSGDDNEKIRSAHLRDETVEGYEKLFQ